MDASKPLLNTYTVVGEKNKGSQNNVMFKARKGKREFFVKFHMKMCPPNIPEMPIIGFWDDRAKIERSHRSAVKRAEKLQKVFEEYYNYKKKLYTAIRGKDKNTNGLNGPLEFWWERVNESPVDGCKVCIEAEPWLSKSADVDKSRGITAVKELPQEVRREIILSFAKNLATLHERGVAHSDIKPNNMVISEEKGKYVGSYIDFDMAFFPAEPPSPVLRKYILGGTDEYNSPEKTIIEYQSEDPDIDISPVGFKADIFALGFSLFEYLTGEKDFPVEIEGEKTRERLLSSVIIQGGKLDLLFNDEYSDKLTDLEIAIICWCLAPEPENRPTANELYQVILNNDLSRVPTMYKRFNYHEPWNSEYVFNYSLFNELRLEVTRTEEPNKYLVKGREGNIVFDEEQLIEIGFLIEPSKSVSSKTESKPWARDKIVYIHKKGVEIVRGKTEGLYVIIKNGIERVVKAENLVSASLAEYTDARKINAPDINKPWEEDLISFTGLAKGIIRASVIGKYIVGKSEVEILNAEELILRGLAKRLPYDISQPFPNDSDMTVTSACEYIFRTRTGHKYIVVSNSSIYLGDKKQLAKHGYVMIPESETEIRDDNVWANDKIVIRPRMDGIVIKKAKIEGKYQVIFPPPNSRVRFKDARGLVAEGYADSVEEISAGNLEELTPSNAIKAVLGIELELSSVNDFILSVDRYERKKKALSMESVRAEERERRKRSEELERIASRDISEERERQAQEDRSNREIEEEKRVRAQVFAELNRSFGSISEIADDRDEEEKARSVAEKKIFQNAPYEYIYDKDYDDNKPVDNYSKKRKRHMVRIIKRFFQIIWKILSSIIITLLCLLVLYVIIVLIVT